MVRVGVVDTIHSENIDVASVELAQWTTDFYSQEPGTVPYP